jgi:hypothetical protein
MNNTNPPDVFERFFSKIHPGLSTFWHGQGILVHVVLIVVFAFLVHALVAFLHRVSEGLINQSQEKKPNPLGFVVQKP